MKPPRVLATRDFWFAISLAALALVSVFLWNQNRQLTVASNHHVVLLCDRVTALDAALVVPLLNEQRELLDFLPPGTPEYQRAKRIENNLEIAHAELSDTTLCASVS